LTFLEEDKSCINQSSKRLSWLEFFLRFMAIFELNVKFVICLYLRQFDQ
jgi:hypothetical protein